MSKFATGEVLFIRYTASVAAFIPEGSRVVTENGQFAFDVVGDHTKLSFDVDQRVYRIAPGDNGISVPVRAVREGADYNVPAQAICRMAYPIPGVDVVTNPLPLTGGDPLDRLYAQAKTSLDDLYARACKLVKTYGGPDQWTAFVELRASVERVGRRSA